MIDHTCRHGHDGDYLPRCVQAFEFCAISVIPCTWRRAYSRQSNTSYPPVSTSTSTSSWIRCGPRDDRGRESRRASSRALEDCPDSRLTRRQQGETQSAVDGDQCDAPCNAVHDQAAANMPQVRDVEAERRVTLLILDNVSQLVVAETRPLYGIGVRGGPHQHMTGVWDIPVDAARHEVRPEALREALLHQHVHDTPVERPSEVPAEGTAKLSVPPCPSRSL